LRSTHGVSRCRPLIGLATSVRLRIALHKDVGELSFECERLPNTISFGLQSRQRVAAATGQTGALQAFKSGCETDSERVATLSQQLQQIGNLDESDNLSILERRLIEAHGVGVEVTQLKAKYQSAMAEDNAARERIHRVHERSR
jgi:hypothetical protein